MADEPTKPWLRVRFYTTSPDWRPIYTPPAYPVGPCWCTGYRGSDDAAVVVAYVSSLDDLRRQWPEAEDIDATEVEAVVFHDRFPKPDWWNEEHPNYGR